jgi:hypothetical protein
VIDVAESVSDRADSQRWASFFHWLGASPWCFLNCREKWLRLA